MNAAHSSTPFLPAIDSTCYLSAYRPHVPSTALICEEALAYLLLNLPEQALAFLDRRVPPDSATYDTEALRLLAMEQAGAVPSDQLARACASALERFGPRERVLEMGLIHAVEGRCFHLVLEMWEQHGARNCLLSPSSQCHMLHNVACAHAALGKTDEALTTLAEAAETHPTPADLGMDRDLAALWEALDAGLSPQQAVILSAPSFKRILRAVEAGQILRSLSASHVPFLPDLVRPWVKRGMSSHWSLDPLCPMELKALYFDWLENWRQDRAALLRRILRHASERSTKLPAS